MKEDLYWQDTMCGGDFETVVTAPTWMRNDTDHEYGADIWLKAYDTSMCESPSEKELARIGYKFMCEARLRHADDGLGYTCLAKRAVRTREDAERFFKDYIEQLEETK